MKVTDALNSRISTRAFLDTPVSKETITELLERASHSPSGGNLQPWKVIVVAGEEKEAASMAAKMALANNPKGEAEGELSIYPTDLKEPYRSRRYKVGEDMYALLGIPREDKAARFQWLVNNFDFFGAPVGLFFVMDECMGKGQFAHLGMFMQSIALVAAEMGLATCMQEAWGMARTSLHKHFELPETDVLYCGMALGFADNDAEVNQLKTDRASVEEFTSFKGI
ncbi:nitroreductase [Kordiimonas laminariae]|uniref:nitroreductase n=1 Tax=Kordiimonas laminariae TaxID=2917717 RepID=UPI001FF236DE|nr:nitroreductase [Kordiimonas laminariae]MCK0070690.1 nitroreductase [Kordiimonas laminariae]